MLGAEAVEFLRGATPGIRVVVRLHEGAGATDALGNLVSTDDDGCVISTTRGEVRVTFDSVIAAKPVPAAPPPRPRRYSAAD